MYSHKVGGTAQWHSVIDLPLQAAHWTISPTAYMDHCTALGTAEESRLDITNCILNILHGHQ